MKGMAMDDTWVLLLFVMGWFGVQYWLLPRLGVAT
jgi:hypothetical protein